MAASRSMRVWAWAISPASTMDDAACRASRAWWRASRPNRSIHRRSAWRRDRPREQLTGAVGEARDLVLVHRVDERLAGREVPVEGARCPTPASRAIARIDGSLFAAAKARVAATSSISRLRAASARR